MSNVKHVTTADFETEVLRASTPVLVDFYATWCMPCKLLAPVLERLARDFDGKAKVLKVDVDREHALIEMFKIGGVPTLKLFRDGAVVDTMVGLVTPDTIVSKLRDALAERPEVAGV